MIRLTTRLVSIGIVALLLVVASAAISGCLPGSGEEGSLTYSGPTEISLSPGETLPGTDLLYVGMTDEQAEFTIDGKRALKKQGDSLNWQGSPAEGVDLTLKLRVALISGDAVHTAGTVKIVVSDAEPSPETLESTDIKFTVPVTHVVKKAEYIPGTLIDYVGRDETLGAEIGVEEGEYPYRKTADSISWEGRLRDNVELSLETRVVLFTDTTLSVGGLATLSIAQ